MSVPVLPACDCVNDCGDDDRVHKGKATPCEYLRVQKLQQQALFDLRTQGDLCDALRSLIYQYTPDDQRIALERAIEALGHEKSPT